MNLEFQNVSLTLGRRQILQTVSFTAPQGCVTALTGRNGAGKSSLIRCLTGEISRYTGRILLDGQDVRALTSAQRSQRMAVLPQQLPLPHVTVEDLVYFGRTPYTPLSGKLRQEDREIVARSLEITGMADMAHRFVDTLSGGERKKAFFAMTLAQDTPLVILDEPTAHLDTASRFEFLDLVDRLGQSSGKTFLVVLHDLPEVLTYAQKMTVLDRGQVCYEGLPQNCISQEIPQRVFRIRITGTAETGYAAAPLQTGENRGIV